MPLQIKYFNKKGVFVDSITKLISGMCSIFLLVWLKVFKVPCVLLHIKNEMRSSILICYNDLLIILTRKSNSSHFLNIYFNAYRVLVLRSFIFQSVLFFTNKNIRWFIFEWSSNLIAPIRTPILYAVYNRIYLIHSLCFCFHSAIKKL